MDRGATDQWVALADPTKDWSGSIVEWPGSFGRHHVLRFTGLAASGRPRWLCRLPSGDEGEVMVPDHAIVVGRCARVPLVECQAASLRGDGECGHKHCPNPDMSRATCRLVGGCAHPDYKGREDEEA